MQEFAALFLGSRHESSEGQMSDIFDAHAADVIADLDDSKNDVETIANALRTTDRIAEIRVLDWVVKAARFPEMDTGRLLEALETRSRVLRGS
jgi:hypothetical protein